MKYAHTDAINPSDTVAIVDVAAAEYEPENDQVRSLARHYPDAGEPGSASWRYLPWDYDTFARAAVIAYGRPMRYDEIGELMGAPSMKVRQIEAQAIRKLQKAAERGLISRDDLNTMVRHWRTMNGEAVE